ncbi:MAG TPA: tRNA-specific adenosine deaminase, partial [Phycisphaerales bacterium]|nr:tRNA-specific adenosine deaminase [Phycisphaerales bacterium]
MMTPETMNQVLEAAIDQARKSWSEGGIPIGSALA